MKCKELVIVRVIVLFLLLSACSPSEAQIATSIAQTEMAKPTATFTPEPTATPTQTAIPTKRPTSTPEPTNISTWDRYKPGTIGNLGVSISTNAKAADYVYTRAEMETYLKEHVYSLEYGEFLDR